MTRTIFKAISMVLVLILTAMALTGCMNAAAEPDTAPPSAEKEQADKPDLTKEPTDGPQYYGFGLTGECSYIQLFFRSAPIGFDRFVIDDKAIINNFIAFINEADFSFASEEETEFAREVSVSSHESIYLGMYDEEGNCLARLAIPRMCEYDEKYGRSFLAAEGEYLTYIGFSYCDADGEKHDGVWFKLNNSDNYNEQFEAVYSAALAGLTHKEIYEIARAADEDEEWWKDHGIRLDTDYAGIVQFNYTEGLENHHGILIEK